MKSLYKHTLALTAVLLACSACDNHGLPNGFINPFPEDAAAYRLAHDETNKDLYLTFPFQVDENLSKLTTIVQYDENHQSHETNLSQPGADGEFDLNKLLHNMKFFYGIAKLDEQGKPIEQGIADAVQECFVFNIEATTNTKEVQCKMHIPDTYVFNANDKIYVTATGSAKFDEDITVQVDSADLPSYQQSQPDHSVVLPANTSATFTISTPVVGISIDSVENFTPETTDPVETAAAAATVGTTGTRKITISDKSFNCANKAVDCTPAPATSSGGNGGGGMCSLNVAASNRSMASVFGSLMLSLSLLFVRRKA